MSKQTPTAHVQSNDQAKGKALDTSQISLDLKNSPPVKGQNSARLPHERDESPNATTDRNASTTSPPRQVIEQAASDITRGLRDAERRGTPSDVPAPGPNPERSPGGAVPAAGIDRHATSTRADQLRKKNDAK